MQSNGLPATMFRQLMSKSRKSRRSQGSKRAQGTQKKRPSQRKRLKRAGIRRRPAVLVAARTAPPSDAASGLAPGMHPINTYLAVANVGATMEFLERTFGFTRGVV